VSGRIQQLRASMLLAGVLMTAAASQPALDGAEAWARAVRAASLDPAIASRVERFVDGVEAHTIAHQIEGQPSLEIISIAAPATAQSLAAAAGQSADRLAAWLGPLPGNRVTIVDVPAQAGLAGAAYPGIAITSSRLLTTRREFAAERALTVAMARQYALALARAPQTDAWFAEGFGEYFATRAVHESFEGRYYLTLRHFGGYVPHSIRAIAMSPNPLDPRPRVARLRDVAPPAGASRRVAPDGGIDRAGRLTMALHTLERFVGWPAFQATLRAFVERSAGKTMALQDFNAVLSEQRGTDMSWFFAQALRTDASLDYAVVNLASAAAADARWTTIVDVRRLGEATFDGTAVPRATLTSRSLPVLVRFADGSEITEWLDGRDREWRFEYSSASPAVLASVDPGAMLLIDADRTNNTRTLNPQLHIVGLRLAFNWLAWLQDAMLTGTAVL
jgi:hypothetical protein